MVLTLEFKHTMQPGEAPRLYLLTIGFCLSGRVGEIFLDGIKVGSILRRRGYARSRRASHRDGCRPQRRVLAHIRPSASLGRAQSVLSQPTNPKPKPDDVERPYRLTFDCRTRRTSDKDTPKARAMVTGLRPALNDARIRFTCPSGI
jgi:hypothetical protein